MITDLVNDIDPHRTNAKELMELKGTDEDRQIAKVFNFRMIYFGSAYAFYMDSRMPDFSLKKWEKTVGGFHHKYSGLSTWWDKLFLEVERNGQIINPTGRILKFSRQAKWDGSLEYNKSTIANYPVQSLSADILQLGLVIARRRLAEISSEIKIIMQVHDSIIIDCPSKYIDKVCKICYSVFMELPYLMEQFFGIKWNVPLTGEVAAGNTWASVKKIPKEVMLAEQSRDYLNSLTTTKG